MDRRAGSLNYGEPFHGTPTPASSKSPDDPFSKYVLVKLDQCYKRMDRLFYDEFPAVAHEMFVKRPRWRRVWVVQEYSVARKAVIMCGHQVLESKYFDNAATVLWYFFWTAFNRSRYFVVPGDEVASKRCSMHATSWLGKLRIGYDALFSSTLSTDSPQKKSTGLCSYY